MKLVPDRDETIVGMLELLANGSTTSLQIVERCLARIDAGDGDLRAWVAGNRSRAEVGLFVMREI